MKPRDDKLVEDGFLPVILLNPIKTTPYKVSEQVVRFVKEKHAQGVPKTTIAGMLSQELGVIISTRTIDRIVSGEYDSVIMPKGKAVEAKPIRKPDIVENPQGIPFYETYIQRLIFDFARKESERYGGETPWLSDEYIASGIKEDVSKMPWPSTWPGMAVLPYEHGAFVKSHGSKPISRSTVQRQRRKLIEYYMKHKKLPFETDLDKEKIDYIMQVIIAGRRREPKNKRFIERAKKGELTVAERNRIISRYKLVRDTLKDTAETIRVKPDILIKDIPEKIAYIVKPKKPKEELTPEEFEKILYEETKKAEAAKKAKKAAKPQKPEAVKTEVPVNVYIAFVGYNLYEMAEEREKLEKFVKDINGTLKAITERDLEALQAKDPAFKEVYGVFKITIPPGALETLEAQLDKLLTKEKWRIYTRDEAGRISEIIGGKGRRGKPKTTGAIGAPMEVTNMDDFNISDIMWDLGGKEYTTKELSDLLEENPRQYYSSRGLLGRLGTKSKVGEAVRAILLEGIQEAVKIGKTTGRQIARYMNSDWRRIKQHRKEAVPLTAFVIYKKKGKNEKGVKWTVIAPRVASALYRTYIEPTEKMVEGSKVYKALKTTITPKPYKKEEMPQKKKTVPIQTEAAKAVRRWFKQAVEEWNKMTDAEREKKGPYRDFIGRRVRELKQEDEARKRAAEEGMGYYGYGLPDIYENPDWIPTTRLGTLLEELDIEENPTIAGDIMSEATKGLMLIVGAAGAGLAINYGIKLGSRFLPWLGRGWGIALTGAVSFVLISFLERLRFLRGVPEDIWNGAKTVSALFVVGGLIGQFFPQFAAMFMPTYQTTVDVGCEGTGCGDAWGGVSFEEVSTGTIVESEPTETEYVAPPTAEPGITFATGDSEVGASSTTSTTGYTEYSEVVLPNIEPERFAFASEEEDM